MKEQSNIYSHFAYIYDQIMSHVPYEEWSHLITGKIFKYNPKAQTLLDAGSGTGNLSYLLSSNFEVDSFDISDDMIYIFKEKFPDLNIWQGDIEKGFNTDKKYHSIVCSYDTVNYLQGKDKLPIFLKNCKKHLHKDGILIFDIITRNKLYNLFKNNFFVHEDTNISFIWYNRFAGKNIFVNKLVFFVKEHDDLYKRYVETHKRTLFSQELIKDEAKKADFTVEEMLDNYSERRADTDSERIVFVLRKGE